jgi:hypothetical protein
VDEFSGKVVAGAGAGAGAGTGADGGGIAFTCGRSGAAPVPLVPLVPGVSVFSSGLRFALLYKYAANATPVIPSATPPTETRFVFDLPPKI